MLKGNDYIYGYKMTDNQVFILFSVTKS